MKRSPVNRFNVLLAVAVWALFLLWILGVFPLWPLWLLGTATGVLMLWTYREPPGVARNAVRCECAGPGRCHATCHVARRADDFQDRP